jgi:DNA-binding response OmpR family regulator
MVKIMVVDDDPHITEIICLYLNKEGFETREVHSGREAAGVFLEYNPNLIVLDLMLPGMDGYQVCREIRKSSKVPIVYVTAKGETMDKIIGLELGADDYIVKPFDPKEMVARVKAVLRRYGNGGSEQQNDSVIINYTGLVINPKTYVVERNGDRLELPPKEFELLHFLARHPNQVFTRDQILDKIWGYEFAGETRTVDVHVKRIREKIEADGKENWTIKTVWGVGYKFEVL